MQKKEYFQIVGIIFNFSFRGNLLVKDLVDVLKEPYVK